MLLINVKEKSEKCSLKLNIQKMKIMASSPITSQQTDGETMETVTDFIFLGFKITVDGDCSHEIKRHLFLGSIGEGNGNTLQCSCLENPRDGRAWWTAVYGIAQSQTQLKRLSSSSSNSSSSKGLVISWLKSPSAVILKPKKIKSVTISTVSPSIFHEVMGLDAMILVF